MEIIHPTSPKIFLPPPLPILKDKERKSETEKAKWLPGDIYFTGNFVKIERDKGKIADKVFHFSQAI